MLWREKEEWWGMQYVARLGNKEARVFEDPFSNGQPTALVTEDGEQIAIGYGPSLQELTKDIQTYMMKEAA